MSRQPDSYGGPSRIHYVSLISFFSHKLSAITYLEWKEQLFGEIEENEDSVSCTLGVEMVIIARITHMRTHP
jgi:hypothetical protein